MRTFANEAFVPDTRDGRRATIAPNISMNLLGFQWLSSGSPVRQSIPWLRDRPEGMVRIVNRTRRRRAHACATDIEIC